MEMGEENMGRKEKKLKKIQKIKNRAGRRSSLGFFYAVDHFFTRKNNLNNTDN